LTVVSHNKPKEGEIRIVYNTGQWNVNFKDSTLIISSGSDPHHPLNVHAKYLSLGSDELKLATTSTFDTIVNGKQLTCKKIVTKHYTHPWIDGFE